MAPKVQTLTPRKHMTADQKLVLEQSLVVKDGHWNPTLRMAQMRDEYDRLVKELGMTPRGSQINLPPPSDVALFPKGAAGLPRVPSDRPWASSTGAKSARARRFKQSGGDMFTPKAGVGGAMSPRSPTKSSAEEEAATWGRV